MKYRLVDYQTVSISKNKISLHSQIPKSQMKDKLFHIFLLVECLKHRPQMNGYSNDDFFFLFYPIVTGIQKPVNLQCKSIE